MQPPTTQTEKEFIYGNTLISEFMEELHFISENDGNVWHPVKIEGISPYSIQCAYHKSWDWLMPVVYKLKQFCVPEQKTKKIQERIENLSMARWDILLHSLCCINIDLVYHQVIIFIQWINKITKNEPSNNTD